MDFTPPSPAARLSHLQAQPDEGYSEETQSLAGEDMDTTRLSKPMSDAALSLCRSLTSLSLDDRVGMLRYIVAGMSLEQQTSFLKEVLFTLPTSAKQNVSAHLDSLMFFDPVHYFPYEIVQNIFSHLNPKELLCASAVSHEWRMHTQDEELWRACFRREGWRVDSAMIKCVENAARHDQGFMRRDSRKKRRLDNHSGMVRQMAIPTLDTEHMDSDNPNIGADVVPQNPTRDMHNSRRLSLDSDISMTSASTTRLDTHFKLKPSTIQSRLGSSDSPRISWAWMYKHRRLLERNWEQGHYQMFRLPHHKYEAEGHAECVYTIQHVGSILVSGSRDRTIRRWDLETCRLRGAPLYGHDASVLCLQFDPTPENDIIVSGGSDSWVIIWRFSTGEIIKKMTTAHTESVLNLRFDDRYIVTCSKDKTIKIWNRRAMLLADPAVPQHVIPQYPDPRPDFMIPEFTLLMKLNGHKAAVNAVMIHEDRIVSASGDREIKAWNISTGRCEKTYTGHTKGIACVQYDGRRIVSGSSDNTVRIFDAEQQAEVACLYGHSNLVRTVQARFGDLEVASDQDLHDEARKADIQWMKAMAQGIQPASGSRRSRRNAGSSRPEDMLSVGAKVPPGGGGTRWARIVSGSYDETVIIWRKDQDGKWTARHKLHQDMLARQRGLRVNRPLPPPGQVMPGAFPPQNVLDAPREGPTHPPTSPNDPLTRDTESGTISPSPAPQPADSISSMQVADGSVASPQHEATVTSPRAQQLRAAINGQGTATIRVNPLHPQQPPPSPALHSMQAPARESNRVFKLQFDTRRIVCCSQNKTIVGWDFANGNEDLARVGTWCEETY